MAKKEEKEESSEEYTDKLNKIIDNLGLDDDEAAEMEISVNKFDLLEFPDISVDNELITGETVYKTTTIEKLDLEGDIEKEGMDNIAEDEEEDLTQRLLDLIDERFDTATTSRSKSKGPTDSKFVDVLEFISEIDKKEVVKPQSTPVYLQFKAYQRMIGYAIRYANEKLDMKKWREVYGILIGSVEDETLVVIKDAIPMVVGDKAGVKYENKQYVDMAQIDESVYERSIEDKKNDFIVGWWHTHPGFGFFYSDVDIETHLGYQVPNPYSVGLIFDHCEKKKDFLGVAGLRLTDPDAGFYSDYKIVELHYDEEYNDINEKIELIIEEIHKHMPKVLKQINYIEKTLNKKGLAQLQRNFGLLLVPKRDVKVVGDEKEAEEGEDKLYEWDPEFFKKKFRIPKFREKVEKEIQRAEKKMLGLLENNQMKKLEEIKVKLSNRIKSLLVKPNEWYEKLTDEFGQKIQSIYPLYDYLDTNERKAIEYFEEKTSKYYMLLEDLNKRAEFKEIG